MILSDVTQVLPGLPFRSRIESETNGTYVVVQARDVTDDGRVDLHRAARLHTLPSSASGLLEAGDIVLQPRGTRFPVGRVGEEPLLAVAAAPLFILRCDITRIRPDYLVALLQSPATQATLKQAAVGTYVPQVPRQAIGSLRIELPDLASQIRLADLARLERREIALMSRLHDARGRLFDLAVKEIAQQRRDHAAIRGNDHG